MMIGLEPGGVVATHTIDTYSFFALDQEEADKNSIEDWVVDIVLYLSLIHI